MEKINIKGQVVTIHTMGTQTAIVETIRRKRGEYVLALKGNQKVLYEEVSLFLNDMVYKHIKNDRDISA